MTDEEYRNKGLSKYLIKRVLADFKEKVDGLYLYANKNVYYYYQQFGFVPVREFQEYFLLEGKKREIRKLDMEDESDKKLFYKFYKLSNPYSKINLIDNLELIMFYCSNYLKDNIYYSESLETAIIMEYEDKEALIYDIYSYQGRIDLLSLVSSFLDHGEYKVKLGFSLKDEYKEDYISREILYDEDLRLFLYELGDNIFKDDKLMFPILSRA